MLGSREWLQKTYKNLEQRVQLECDGQRIPLPSLQGIVVLNIPSFMGGTNFWGGTKEDDCFLAPSFDDRVLEVVAVFGSVQMAASRLINLQHHRIAQCQTVQINVLGTFEKFIFPPKTKAETFYFDMFFVRRWRSANSSGRWGLDSATWSDSNHTQEQNADVVPQ